MGYADIPAGTAFAVARYTTAGVLDPSFGAGVGYVTTRIDNDFSPGTVMIQPDQKILVGGQYNGNTCLLVRYNTDGSLDTQTFGDGAGYVTTIIRNNAGAVLVGGQINSLLIQLDGKIVAAGQVTDGVQKFLITRYNLDGSLNTTFGSGATGYVITKVGGVADNSIAQDVALQADGKVVVIGKSATHFAIARYINPFTLVSFTASYGNVGLL